MQLIKEKAQVAGAYKNKSVAEQNSIELAWNLLMEPCYKELRNCIFLTQAELARFRGLVVTAVMATDIADKELASLRKLRAAEALNLRREDIPDDEIVNKKATFVLETLIQAADVYHTMQPFSTYKKWNHKLYKEMYAAYKAGRAEYDPTETWFKGDIGFFDFYIIPLARKLKDCGIFGKAADDYLKNAMMNRLEWELRGEKIVESYHAAAIKKAESSPRVSLAELASQNESDSDSDSDSFSKNQASRNNSKSEIGSFSADNHSSFSSGEEEKKEERKVAKQSVREKAAIRSKQSNSEKEDAPQGKKSTKVVTSSGDGLGKAKNSSHNPSTHASGTYLAPTLVRSKASQLGPEPPKRRVVYRAQSNSSTESAGDGSASERRRTLRMESGELSCGSDFENTEDRRKMVRMGSGNLSCGSDPKSVASASKAAKPPSGKIKTEKKLRKRSKSLDTGSEHHVTKAKEKLREAKSKSKKSSGGEKIEKDDRKDRSEKKKTEKRKPERVKGDAERAEKGQAEKEQ